MNHLKHGWTAGLVCLAMLGLVACGGGGGGETPPPSTVTSVTVSPGELSLEVGATGELTVEVVVTGSASKAVTWSSGDQAVATVAANGTVTAVAAGTTLITATSDHDATRQGGATVTVTAADDVDGDGDGDGTGDEDPEPQVRTVEFGSSGPDSGYGITVDAQGNMIVVGATKGKLGEDRYRGQWDAFVAKLTPTGERVWLRQIGTSSDDTAAAVATDGDGNVFVAGTTWGSLFASNAGGADVFIVKYSPDGELVWSDQFGVAGHDFASAIALDGDAVLVAGSGMNGGPTIRQAGDPGGFILRLNEDASGEDITLEWTLLLAEPFTDMVVTDDFMYVTGSVAVDGLGHEVFVLRIELDGTESESAVFGSGKPGTNRAVPETRQPVELWKALRGDRDVSTAIVVDADGNMYVTGSVGGFNTGTGMTNERAFLLRLTPDLKEDWALIFESAHFDTGTGLALDADGNVILITSATSYYDRTAAPGVEMVTRKVSPEGELLWESTYGGDGWDRNNGVTLDADGNVFVVGATYGEEGVGNRTGTAVFIRVEGR